MSVFICILYFQKSSMGMLQILMKLCLGDFRWLEAMEKAIHPITQVTIGQWWAVAASTTWYQYTKVHYAIIAKQLDLDMVVRCIVVILITL